MPVEEKKRSREFDVSRLVVFLLRPLLATDDHPTHVLGTSHDTARRDKTLHCVGPFPTSLQRAAPSSSPALRLRLDSDRTTFLSPRRTTARPAEGRKTDVADAVLKRAHHTCTRPSPWRAFSGSRCCGRGHRRLSSSSPHSRRRPRGRCGHNDHSRSRHSCPSGGEHTSSGPRRTSSPPPSPCPG